MSRRCKTFVYLWMLLSGLMIWQQQALAANTGISAEDIASLDDGRDIYEGNCAACHGFDGVPIMAGVPNFGKNERMEKSDQELLASIKNGKAPESGGVAMPPWTGILDEEEMLSVLTYARVINGVPVFQDNCMSCHESGVPPAASSVPTTSEKLHAYQGPFNLCKETDTDNAMEREDIIKVIQFLAGVSKN